MNELIEDFVSRLIEEGETISKNFKKGDTIIYQGEKLNHIFFLEKGECYRKSLTDNGEELIYDVRTVESGIHRLLGVLILYSTTKISTTSFIAKTDCTCYRITEAQFVSYVNDHPDILHELIRISVNNNDLLDLKYHLRISGKAANQLCEIILQKIEQDNGKPFSKIPNHSELARIIGVHRVSIVRILKQLEDEGIIRRVKNGVEILDMGSVEKYALGKKFNYKK